MGTSFVREWCAAAAGLLRELGYLLFPRGCAGCDAPDEVLCSRCESKFHHCIPFRLHPGTLHLGFACALSRGVAREAILNWKDHGDEECDGAFVTALNRLFDDLLAFCRQSGAQFPQAAVPNDILIVPAPSSASSLRRRGRSQLAPLAKALCSHANARGMQTTVAPLLIVRAHSKSVETNGADQRAQRARRTICINERATHDKEMDACRTVILIDDIVTTGATINRCATVLAEHGYTVFTALALAYTPSKHGYMVA